MYQGRDIATVTSARALRRTSSSSRWTDTTIPALRWNGAVGSRTSDTMDTRLRMTRRAVMRCMTNPSVAPAAHSTVRGPCAPITTGARSRSRSNPAYAAR